jgi:MGT family glycosyltransferase
VSRFLFTVWEGGGDTPPTISVMRGLVRAGHDVTALADPVLRPDVEDAGATWRCWTEAPQKGSYSPEEDLARDWEARTPLGAFRRFRDGIAFGPAARYARDTAAEIQRRRPDVVIGSILMFGGQAAAEAAGVRQASLMTTCFCIPGTGAAPYGSGFAPPRTAPQRLRQGLMDRAAVRLWAKGRGPLNDARAELGLPPVAHPFDQIFRTDRLLVLTSRAFDFPVARLPANVRYVGPRLEDPVWSGGWTPPPGDEPLVLVGLSSTYMRQEETLRRIVDALGALRVRAVVTLGPALEGADLPAPPNVLVVQSAPHAEVLRHAAATVSHGGHGTAIKSLAAGVPLVVVPAGRDQPDTAARVAAAGAGIRLSPKASAEHIRVAVAEVLSERRYRAAAGRLAAEIAADLREDLALAELEALAVGATARGAGEQVAATAI